ncbi:MAG: 16S rRNA (guanine(966)-N(2))-methyltransferase RsmD [Marinobacterium sp.]|nr:16S rRNA (guanine(966)-N(2))-methyltransferase RsmD [Marinobacterium sp.]
MPRQNPSRQQRPGNRNTPVSTLRIVGGQWRGRKIPFPAIDGLRPTPDRVRETLFNWLQSQIAGAHCLDLYTGSGALGLEALSRGAASCTFVDRDSQVIRQLGDNLKLLGSGDAELVQAGADQWLAMQSAASRRPFDIVFMDPPFRQNRVAADCALLAEKGLLADSAIVYVETESDLTDPGVPVTWHEHRHKKAGQVSSRLFFTARN